MFKAMRTESAVLARFSDEIAERISKRVVASLKKAKETLSGDDSDLKNVWEELCAQVQLDQSYFWDAYDEMVKSLVVPYVEKLKEHELLALWFQTDEGIDWSSPNRIISADDYPDGYDEYEEPPATVDSVVEYIVAENIYEKAGEYSNRNIQAWLERQWAD